MAPGSASIGHAEAKAGPSPPEHAGWLSASRSCLRGGSRPAVRLFRRLAAGPAAVPVLGRISVSAAACGTGWRHPVAGVQTLQIHNAFTSTVEVRLENPANGAVYAQVEGIGPGTTRSMPVDLGSGQYSFSCSGLNYGTRMGPIIQVLGGSRAAARFPR